MNIRHAIALTALGGIAAVLLVANGFASASAPTPVGERINVYLGSPTTFPAGQPFNIRHGWGIGPAEAAAAGIYSFRLDVDGTARPADDVARSTGSPPTTEYELPILNRTWIFNFPAGMTGTHRFTGHWIAPCKTAVEEMGYPGPCLSPAEPVEALTRSLTVDFMRENLALGRSVTASNEYTGSPASQAVDGDWWAIWNSGDCAPQWIEVDLGAVQPVGEIDLGVAQYPDCQTDHRLYGRSSTSEGYTLLREFNEFTVDQQVLRFLANPARQLRYVRVETTSSCSWIAWREIEVYASSA
jgi:F5/8 type C domain